MNKVVYVNHLLVVGAAVNVHTFMSQHDVTEITGAVMPGIIRIGDQPLHGGGILIMSQPDALVG